MESSNLIPRSKMDFERIELLRSSSEKEIVAILPELLEWVQDMNWPIARDIEDIIIKYEEHLIPYIRTVLKTSDGSWKYFLLHGLINRLSKEILIVLKPDLLRMKFIPTNDEQQEELSEILDELLSRIE